MCFVALAASEEVASRHFGLASERGSWTGKYDAGALLIRLPAIILLYPVAEELFFRGAFLGMLLRRFGVAVAVTGSAALFAISHLQYAWEEMLFVLADGLFFGICRVRGRSVPTPMFLHALGNSYAVWERLH